MFSPVFADCYITNLGDGERIHDCEYSRQGGYEINYENGYGYLLRNDGYIDDVLDLGDGFAFILRYDGNIDDAIGIGDGDSIIMHNIMSVDETIGSHDAQALIYQSAD